MASTDTYNADNDIDTIELSDRGIGQPPPLALDSMVAAADKNADDDDDLFASSRDLDGVGGEPIGMGCSMERMCAVLRPGSKQSRKSYEIIRDTPVALSLLWLLVPFAFQTGEAEQGLDRALYSFAFSGFYSLIPAVFAITAYCTVLPAPPRLGCILVVAASVAVNCILEFVVLSAYPDEVLRGLLTPVALLVASIIIISFLAFHATKAPSVPPKVLASGEGPHSNKRVFGALLASFATLLLFYYWTQVFVRFIWKGIDRGLGQGSGNFLFLGVLALQVSVLLTTSIMSQLAKAKNFTAPETNPNHARALSLIMTFSIQLTGMSVERQLFTTFTTLSSVIMAQVQRTALQLLTRHFRYTPTGYRAYYTVRKLVSRCLGGKILASAPPPYKEDLAENLRKFAMDKLAEFISLTTWLGGYIILRFTWNVDRFPYGPAIVSSSRFSLILAYYAISAAVEFVLLIMVRARAAARGVRYLDDAMSVFKPRITRMTYVMVATHVVMDVFVALATPPL